MLPMSNYLYSQFKALIKIKLSKSIKPKTIISDQLLTTLKSFGKPSVNETIIVTG